MIIQKVQHYVFWKNKEQFHLAEDQDSEWVMYIIEKGSCHFTINRTKGIGKAHTIIICPPNTTLKREVIETMSFHLLKFRMKHSRLKMPYFIDEDEIRNKARLASTLDSLKAIRFEESANYVELRNHLVNDIFYLYFEEYSAPMELKQELRDTIMIEALNYLSDISPDALSIEEIASKLNFNASHFSRKFKQMIGIPPIEHRNKVKLTAAKKLLVETNDNIEVIAEKCGYSNGYYFSRLFKEKINDTPSNYRRQRRA